MSENHKKQAFLGRVERVFSHADTDVYADLHCQEFDSFDEDSSGFIAPYHWSPVAVEVFADDAVTSVHADTQTIEENTVPSWLWRRAGRGQRMTCENDVRQIFDRVVGGATYAGWKQNLFTNENHARTFFDEARAVLINRAVAIEPRALKSFGLRWVGAGKSTRSVAVAANAVTDISNSAIDNVVRGVADKTLRAKLNKLWPHRGSVHRADLRLSDIAGDWGNPTAGDFAAVVDVMAFRHNDGHINIEKLRHAVRLTTVLLDLQSDDKVTDFRIGIANLAPLLLAQAVAYDSEAGRALCAAICGLVTAEAFAVSAELAALRGASASFFAERETILRVLRNHSRAVHGDKTDYEKISVLPHPLSLQHCPDLALAAAAQSRWSEVLHRVRQNGLRQTQVTSLQGVPTITAFMESVTQGVEALSALTMLRQTDDDDFQNDVLPAVPEALERLGYDRTLKPENVRASHKGIFAVSEKVRVEARIQMAAAVQGLISGDTGLTVSLPVNSTAENNERLLLSAWRQGVRSLSMDFDAAPVTKKIVEKKAARKIRASEFIHTTQPPTSLPRRGARLKAASSLVHMEHRPKPLLGRGKRG